MSIFANAASQHMLALDEENISVIFKARDIRLAARALAEVRDVEKMRVAFASAGLDPDNPIRDVDAVNTKLREHIQSLSERIMDYERKLDDAREDLAKRNDEVVKLSARNQELTKLNEEIVKPTPTDFEDIYIVFSKLPGHDAPNFIEVEDQYGQTISAGEWVNSIGHDALKLAVATKEIHSAVKKATKE